MSIASTVWYVLLCVAYACRATFLFTVELLFFLPLYCLVERHDTQSRWLGRRGEAQLQPLLPTAFEYERARAGSEEGVATQGAAGGSFPAAAPAKGTGELEASTSLDIPAQCTSRCRRARDAVCRLRSLRASTQVPRRQARQSSLDRRTRSYTPGSSCVSDALLQTGHSHAADASSTDTSNKEDEEEKQEEQGLESQGSLRGSPVHHLEVTDAFFPGGCAVRAAVGDAAMCDAIPAWCTVRFEAGPTAGVEGDIAPQRQPGQYGFLPPWYAVHARAQLLWAHLDPLFRMMGELLCLRGWASSSASSSISTVAAVTATAISHPRTSAPVRSPEEGKASSLCSATSRSPTSSAHLVGTGQCARGGTTSAGAPATEAGGPLRRLSAELHRRVDVYVADTSPLFEALDVTSVAIRRGDGWPTPPQTTDASAAATQDTRGGGGAKAYAPPSPVSLKDEGQQHQQQGTPSTAAPAAECRRSLGVCWLHKRRPEFNAGVVKGSAPPPPLVLLLLCPSLLQGNGLYASAVARIGHICQLLTLAASWSQPSTEAHNGSSSSSGGDGTAAQWYAAVPVVELRATAAAAATTTSPTSTPTTGSAPGSASAAAAAADVVSTPPLTLKDLRVIVGRLRRLCCPPPPPPSHDNYHDSCHDERQRQHQQHQPLRKVVIVAVGWSEAASPLLELAMTQQQGQGRRTYADTEARLDGLVCLSHTLSSTFQLLPQQRDAMLALHRPFHLGTSFSSQRSQASERGSRRGDGSGGGGGVTPLALPAYANFYTTPHIPRMLSYLTTGPARLLLLLTRMQLIADHLVAQRHQHNESRAKRQRSDGTLSTGAEEREASAQLPLTLLPLLRFRDAREQANATQSGLDAPTLLWSHAQQRNGGGGGDHRQGHDLVGNMSSASLLTAGRSSGGNTTRQSQAVVVEGATAPLPRTPPEHTQVATSLPPAVTAHSLQGIPVAATAAPSASETRRVSAVRAAVTNPTSKLTEESTAVLCTDGKDHVGSAISPQHFTQQQQQQQWHQQVFASPFQSHLTSSEADCLAYQAALPHLETLTNWEELLRTEAMTELQRQQRRASANTTAALLPDPLSLDSPLTLHTNSAGAVDRLLARRAESEDVGTPGTSSIPDRYALGGQRDGANARSGSEGSTGGALTARPSPHLLPSRAASPLQAAPPSSTAFFRPSLRSMQSHMSTEDVVASCTLQCVVPNSRQPPTLRYPEGGQSSQTYNSSNNDSGSGVGKTIYSPQQQQQQQRTGGSTLRRFVPAKEANVWGRADQWIVPCGVAAARGTAPEAAAATGQSADLTTSLPVEWASDLTDGAFHSAGPQPSSTLTDLADVSFSSPYSLARGNSTGPSFRGATAAAASVTSPPLSPQGPQRQRLQQKQQHPSSRHQGGEERSSTDAVASAPSTTPPTYTAAARVAEQGIVEILHPYTTTPTTAGGVSDARHLPADPHQFLSSHSPSQQMGTATTTHTHTDSNTAATSAAAVTSPSRSPPPSPIPYPPPAPARTRAFTSQAAALVELRVRAAQHAALIQRIRIPALLLHARDDPVAPPATVPFSLLQANPWITTVLTRRGSHATYMESAAEVWQRPCLVLLCEEEVIRASPQQLPLRRSLAERRQRSCVADGKTTTVAAEVDLVSSGSSTDSRSLSPSTDGSSTTTDRDFCLNSSLNTGESPPQEQLLSPLPMPQRRRNLAADAKSGPQRRRRRVRVEGTTWVERFLFEYVERVVLTSVAEVTG